ncbi:unnamed protein product, partial [Prunus brigantina]
RILLTVLFVWGASSMQPCVPSSLHHKMCKFRDLSVTSPHSRESQFKG